jgi:hypothetical protein
MIIHAMVGNLKVHGSPIPFLKSSGFSFTDMNSIVTIANWDEVYGDGGGIEYVSSNEINIASGPILLQELVEIKAYDHVDMDDTWKALEQDLLDIINNDKVIDLSHLISPIIITDTSTSITISNDTYVLSGIDEAALHAYNYGHTVSDLVYLGDDMFTILDYGVKVGVKTSEPCGFFLEYRKKGYKRFKIEGLGRYLKEKGVISEER